MLPGNPSLSFIGSFSLCLLELPRSYGRPDYRGGDLRDKLDRRYSPRRRYSPGRDPRPPHGFRSYKPISRDRGHSLSRSPIRRSDGRYTKRHAFDGQSDRSESLKASDVDEDHKKRRASYDEKDLLEELKQLRSDLGKLDEHKSELENLLEDKIDEAHKLTGKIEDLEKQLNKEEDDCRRFTSKIKKFIKLHGRCLRMQEELKRTQDRFCRFGDHIVLDVIKGGGTEEDSSPNIASDVELNEDGNNSPKNVELQNHVSTSKKRRLHQPSGDEAKIGSSRKKERHSGPSTRFENLGKPEGPVPPSEDTSKDISSLKFKLKGKYAYNYLAHVGKPKKGKSSPSYASTDKARDFEAVRVIPSTSMAAHAVDELIESFDVDEKSQMLEDTSNREQGLDRVNPSYVPPVPLMMNDYKELEGDDDEEVDIEKVEPDMVDVGTIGEVDI